MRSDPFVVETEKTRSIEELAKLNAYTFLFFYYTLPCTREKEEEEAKTISNSLL